MIENFTNSATLAGAKASFERDLTSKDRLRLSLSFNRAGFMVPNELIQEQGRGTGVPQRQDRNNREVSGQIAYQHTFSSSMLGTVQGRVRDDEAGLTSNPYSTPIEAFQDRGFREGYLSSTLSVTHGNHEFKAGADAIYSLVHEQFSFDVTCYYSVAQSYCLDPSTPPSFLFHKSGDDWEQAFFVQDSAHFGNVSVSAGIRVDHYSLGVDETAWSPRLGFAWYVPKLGVVFRGSYDRAFGTPAVENLLVHVRAGADTEPGSAATSGATVAGQLLRTGRYQGTFSQGAHFRERFPARYSQLR